MAAFSTSDASCVLALDFEDNVTDQSGEGNDGALQGGATYETGDVDNKWLTVDGNDDFVQVADSATLDFTGAFTISAWIKPTSTNSNNILVSKRDAYTSTGIPYEINIANGTSVSFRVVGSNPLDTAALFAVNSINHICCTWDGTTARVYVNGRLATSGTRSGPITANNQPVCVGALPGGFEEFTGKIDRFFIFTEEKSATDVLGEYQAFGALSEQEGFRFRDDDGSETTASWLAAQDTNISRDLSDPTRLRVLINSTGDLPSRSYQLEYKKNSGDWKKVLVSGGYSDELTTGGTPSASHENQSAEGSDEAFDGSASTKWLAFNTTPWLQYRFASSATHLVTKYAITSGNDDDTRDPYNWTLKGSNDGSSWTVVDTVTGETFASRGLRKEFICDTPGTTAYEYYRLDISANNGNGSLTQLAELELYKDAVEEILLVASANITASGDNTTAQLTAPSGKTTADFTTGRMQDDENPADAIDIADDDYTELEWCLEATTDASISDVYTFRVTRAGVVLDTYTVTPAMTIGSALVKDLLGCGLMPFAR